MALKDSSELVKMYAMVNVKPVSYTHLDVYKRQVTHRVRNTIMPPLFGGGEKILLISDLQDHASQYRLFQGCV